MWPMVEALPVSAWQETGYDKPRLPTTSAPLITEVYFLYEVDEYICNKEARTRNTYQSLKKSS